MSSKTRTLGLFEFLEEAELQHHYNALKNVLQVSAKTFLENGDCSCRSCDSFSQVHNVQQLKFVIEEDLFNIGMSRPEARRLKTFYSKVDACKIARFMYKV